MGDVVPIRKPSERRDAIMRLAAAGKRPPSTSFVDPEPKPKLEDTQPELEALPLESEGGAAAWALVSIAFLAGFVCGIVAAFASVLWIAM